MIWGGVQYPPSHQVTPYAKGATTGTDQPWWAALHVPSTPLPMVTWGKETGQTLGQWDREKGLLASFVCMNPRVSTNACLGLCVCVRTHVCVHV